MAKELKLDTQIFESFMNAVTADNGDDEELHVIAIVVKKGHAPITCSTVESEVDMRNIFTWLAVRSPSQREVIKTDSQKVN